MSSSAGRLNAFYDGRCSLCERARRFAITLDWRQRLVFTDLHDQAAMQVCLPGLSQSESLATLHLLLDDGQILRGFAAIRRMMRELPLLTLLAWCLYVPPFHIMGEKAYRIIARNRPCKPEHSP